MFVDDRSRLLQIGEWLTLLKEGLEQPNSLADEVAWWRLGMIEQAYSRLSSAYRADHPEITALGLPTLDEVLNEPPPVPAVTAERAWRVMEAFRPLLNNLPPPPLDRPVSPHQSSRLEELVSKLAHMEQYLRSRGISALYLFGSVARREDQPGSDIDLAFVLADGAAECFSLFDQIGIRDEIAVSQGLDVDFVEERALRGVMRDRYFRDRRIIFD